MKAKRVFLAFIYLLFVGILPTAHVAFGLCTSSTHYSCCSVPQEEPEDSGHSSGHNHSHETCLSCQLLLQQIDTPEVLTDVRVPVSVEEVPVPVYTAVSLSPSIPQQARAPPFFNIV